jgi:hypothetical protein
MYVKGEKPATREAQKYYKMIFNHRIYFKNNFNGYWELAHLPYNKGIDEHRSDIIDLLLLVQSYVNQHISNKKDKKVRRVNNGAKPRQTRCASQLEPIIS